MVNHLITGGRQSLTGKQLRNSGWVRVRKKGQESTFLDDKIPSLEAAFEVSGSGQEITEVGMEEEPSITVNCIQEAGAGSAGLPLSDVVAVSAVDGALVELELLDTVAEEEGEFKKADDGDMVLVADVDHATLEKTENAQMEIPLAKKKVIKIGGAYNAFGAKKKFAQILKSPRKKVVPKNQVRIGEGLYPTKTKGDSGF